MLISRRHPGTAGPSREFNQFPENRVRPRPPGWRNNNSACRPQEKRVCVVLFKQNAKTLMYFVADAAPGRTEVVYVLSRGEIRPLLNSTQSRERIYYTLGAVGNSCVGDDRSGARRYTGWFFFLSIDYLLICVYWGLTGLIYLFGTPWIHGNFSLSNTFISNQIRIEKKMLLNKYQIIIQYYYMRCNGLKFTSDEWVRVISSKYGLAIYFFFHICIGVIIY